MTALTVVANESYEDYVKSLQKEIEEDFGEDEAKKLKVTNQRQKKKVKCKPLDELPKEFEELWNRIRAKTRYSVQVDTNALVKRVVDDLNKLTIEPPRLVVTKARVQADESKNLFTALQMPDTSPTRSGSITNSSPAPTNCAGERPSGVSDPESADRQPIRPQARSATYHGGYPQVGPSDRA